VDGNICTGFIFAYMFLDLNGAILVADEMLENGDLAGKVAWLRILEASKEILMENTRGTIH